MHPTIFVLFAIISTIFANGSDYIAVAPPTVYEDPVMSPQNMDYDAENNMFIAHPGWLEDKLIYYYKFRMYTPMTYPTHIPMDGEPDIPIGELYLLTTVNNSYADLVSNQLPIVRYHTADGESYSDFVVIYFALVNTSYVANSHKSYGDLIENSIPLYNSGHYVNLPVVPTGSKLQNPELGGTNIAPIDPLEACQEFADTFNPITRASEPEGYQMDVVSYVYNAQVAYLPVWHLNQYWNGVETGVNNGGPWSGGQRNIIHLDRKDSGYSPIWQVYWVSVVPMDYSADMASNNDDLVTDNGFEIMITPMYVNCPNIGPYGGRATNENKADTFIKTEFHQGETFAIQGSLVMESNVSIAAYLDEEIIASSYTGMMGAYLLEIDSNLLPLGESTLIVKDPLGNTLQQQQVEISSASLLNAGFLFVCLTLMISIF